MATKPSKCAFFKESVKFLGHIVDQQGSRPSKKNVEAITNFETPRTVRQVRSFLGTVNFYRKFIKDVTKIAAPLYNLIKKDRVRINWTPECDQAFLKLKETLVSAPVLSYPDFNLPFIIKCDASDIGIGGVLEQEKQGEVHPIAYCSRKLNKAERNYSVIEREALAIVFTLSQFRHLVYGYKIVLKTDHKPLSYVFKLKDSNQRLVRWLLQVQDYNLQIEHIPGKFNYVADMLSRGDETSQILNVNALKATEEAITNNKIKEFQLKDDVCMSLINKVKNGYFKNDEYVMDEHMVLLKQVFPNRSRGWKYRIVVPSALRSVIIHNYHDGVGEGHFSISKVLFKIKLLFTWNHMYKDVFEYIKTCEKCQRRSVPRVKAPFQPVAPPSFPMQRLSLDLLGPFSRTKKGNRYVILYCDNMTRMIFGSPIPNMEAGTVAQDYIDNVYSRYGASQEIVSDRGGQFMGAIFQNLCKKLGITHITTSSYHPNSNGISERSNGKILNVLAQMCNKNFDNWDDILPLAIHALNTNPHRSTNETPFFLFHSFDPVDPKIEASATHHERFENISDFTEQTTFKIEQVRAEVVDLLMKSSEYNCQARNSNRKLKEFNLGQLVLYLDSTSYTGKNRKLKQRFIGPFRVIEKTGLVNYRIRNIKLPNQVKSVHVDKLKLYFPRNLINDEKPRQGKPKQTRRSPILTQPLSSEEEDLLFVPVRRGIVDVASSSPGAGQNSRPVNLIQNSDLCVSNDSNQNSNITNKIILDDVHFGEEGEPDANVLRSDDNAPTPLYPTIQEPIKQKYSLRTKHYRPARLND